MQALAGAVDTNPPGFHLLMRGFCTILGGVTPLNLRLFSLLSIYLSLVGLFACLRTSLGFFASAAGVVALWCIPLVVHHAFEARFYGPTLAASVWLAFLVIRFRSTRRPFLVGAGIAGVSVVLCTVHYFGIFSLGSIMVGALLASRDRRTLIAIATSGICGVASLAACIPLFLSQRTGLRSSTWVDPVNEQMLIAFATDLFPPTLIGLVVGWWLLSRLIDRGPKPLIAVRPLLPLVALIGVAPIVLIFSLVVQPALVSRYAISSTGAVAGLIAIAFATCRGRHLFAVIVLLIFCAAPRPTFRDGQFTFRRSVLTAQVYRWTSFNSTVTRFVEDIRKQTPGAIVLFELRQNLYPVTAAAPDLRDRCVYFDTTGVKRAGSFELYEADMAERVQRFYGWPRVMHPRDVPLDQPCYRVVGDDTLARIR